jgi:DNA repair protein RecO (recombination protein O)
VAARAVTTDAIVLRSLRYGEADRILHLFTAERGRVGAIAKGARKVRSRFGARVEPFSHTAVELHFGRGELATLTGADLVRSHQAIRDDHRRVAVAEIGAEAVLRLFGEHDPNSRVLPAIARYLDVLEEQPPPAVAARLDPLAIGFQLKLLWLAGYLPHLESCAECGGVAPLVGFAPASGGAVCAACQPGALPLSPAGLAGARVLLERPLADARERGPRDLAAREALRMVEEVYAFHGGFRLRTLAR